MGASRKACGGVDSAPLGGCFEEMLTTTRNLRLAGLLLLVGGLLLAALLSGCQGTGSARESSSGARLPAIAGGGDAASQEELSTLLVEAKGVYYRSRQLMTPVVAKETLEQMQELLVEGHSQVSFDVWVVDTTEMVVEWSWETTRNDVRFHPHYTGDFARVSSGYTVYQPKFEVIYVDELHRARSRVSAGFSFKRVVKVEMKELPPAEAGAYPWLLLLYTQDYRYLALRAPNEALARSFTDAVVTMAAAAGSDVHDRVATGLEVSALSSKQVEAYGLEEGVGGVVTEVYRNSPAIEAGVREGDVIVAVNGQPFIAPGLAKLPVPQSLTLRESSLRLGLLRLGGNGLPSERVELEIRFQ